MNFLEKVPVSNKGAITSGPDNDYWLVDHQEHYLYGLRNLGDGSAYMNMITDGSQTMVALMWEAWIGIEHSAMKTYATAVQCQVCLDHCKQRSKKNKTVRPMTGQQPTQVQ
eukprot:scaffold119479_cov20-Prasinocladus_malaysianus.AAC.1